eukprot:12696025-Ditylum_brightwellii.AAC.1
MCLGNHETKKSDAKKKKEKELHLHEKEDKEDEILMTELAFTDSKEEYFNSKCNSPTVQRVHPETIIAMPIAPSLKKMKMVRVLLDMCATLLLMDPALLDDPLSKYKESKVLSTKLKTQWKTGSRNFESTGQLTVENVCLPLFTCNRRFGAQFDFLLMVAKGHTY